MARADTELSAAPSISALPIPRSIAVDGAELVAVARDAVAVGANLWVRVHGGSMAPAIPVNAEVRLAKLVANQPSVGDVVLARTATGQPMLHRVRAIRGQRIQLQGDNLLTPDDPLSLSDIVAIADAVRVDGRVAPIAAAQRSVGTRVARLLRLLRRRIVNG